MTVKMIVTDLDGTLFRSDKTISAYSKAVIRRCQAAGIRFAVATARMRRLVNHFIPDIRFDGYVFHNGASVYYGGKEIASCKIRAEAVRKTIDAIQSARPQAQLAVQANETFYSNYDAAVMTKTSVMLQRDLSALPDCDAEKINVIVASPSEAASYKRFLDDDLYIVCSENIFGMIMRKDATKLNGIRALAQEAGLQMSEIAAFGDDYNDLDMLKGCGLGIAMGNAIDAVKADADYVCGDNDSDGVAKWIEEHILK